LLPATTPRRELIRKFQALGYHGPYSGGKHPFMTNGKHKQRIPNKHAGDIGRALLERILAQAGISHEVWNAL
jgi:predicted RNA binding protein YcfA (HicA-like mRNA interferase family)